MQITFWKNNKLDQEYKLDIYTVITDYIKSKYQTGDYPFERRLNMFLMDKDYGSYEPFTSKEWDEIYNIYNSLNTVGTVLICPTEMKNKIIKLLRDLRDNTPCDEESTNCGCEKFDEIIDLVDQLN